MEVTETGPGAGVVYELVEHHGLERLDERERRLLDGALTVHALTSGGRALRATVLRGPRAALPSLADHATRVLEFPDSRVPLATVTVQPLRGGVDGPAREVVIDLGGESDPRPAYDVLPGRRGSLHRTVRYRAPIQFDALRQWRTDRLERSLRSRSVPRAGVVDVPAGAAPSGREPAVLFGVHWLEMGGAERWALECVQLAAAAGLRPVVLVDRPSAHPWITRPELAGAIVLPLTHPLLPEIESGLLSAVLEHFDVRGVHLHHSSWLYGRLPWLRARAPHVPVVDSLHVVEWRTGGFADISVRMSSVIDTHHVISPHLRDYLVDRQGLDRTRVELATLADLTAAERGPAQLAGSAGDNPVVAFVGRFTQQKRPYLFLELAQRIRRQRGAGVRFVVHGDGELRDEVVQLRHRLGLDDVLELRGPDVPVADTLAQAAVLVVCSDNEGLTLTSFEADSADVLVLSTDVGSQASLVATEALLPRHPYPFLRRASALVGEILDEPARRKELLAEQHAKADAFAALPRARSWATALYERWAS